MSEPDSLPAVPDIEDPEDEQSTTKRSAIHRIVHVSLHQPWLAGKCKCTRRPEI